MGDHPRITEVSRATPLHIVCFQAVPWQDSADQRSAAEDPLPDTGSTLPQMQRGIKAYKQLKEGKVPEEAYSHMGSFEGMARKYTPESMRAPKEKRSLHARFTEPGKSKSSPTYEKVYRD